MRKENRRKDRVRSRSVERESICPFYLGCASLGNQIGPSSKILICSPLLARAKDRREGEKRRGLPGLVGRCFFSSPCRPLAGRRRSPLLCVGHSRFLARIAIPNRPLSRALARPHTPRGEEERKQTRKSGETHISFRCSLEKELDPIDLRTMRPGGVSFSQFLTGQSSAEDGAPVHGLGGRRADDDRGAATGRGDRGGARGDARGGGEGESHFFFGGGEEERKRS